MYEPFKHNQYPIVPFSSITGLNETQADFLKTHFIDFKTQIYSNTINNAVYVYLVRVLHEADKILFYFTFTSKSYEIAALLKLEFDLANPDLSQFVRVHFDSSDFEFINSDITAINGYISLFDIPSFVPMFSSNNPNNTIRLMLEPSTVSIIGNHRVDNFKTQFAKPLLIQSESSTEIYEPVSEPVTGHVKFVGGNNCIITVQEVPNNVVISAVRNANGTPEERCGIWNQPVASKDILCDEPVYSLGGAYPDNDGNIVISGQYPLSVSVLTNEEVRNQLPNFSINSSYNHIANFIVIGSITGQDFEENCQPNNTDICNP